MKITQKEQKLILNPDSRMIVTRKVEEFIDMDGRNMMKVSQNVEDTPINLGSIVKPQTKI